MTSLEDARAFMERTMGFRSFRPGQEAVIERLVEGRSTAAVFPTGAGKSLCYQVPALCFPGLTLVVSPLLALMKDQIDFLKRCGVAAERLDSTLSAAESRSVIQGLKSGDFKILYVAPERFQNERFREVVGQLEISLFAVDEAHCISEWGHNFRPDYLKLAEAAVEFGAERCLALTATATPPVLRDICRAFRVEDDDAIVTGFYRPNLTLRFTSTTREDRDRILEERLKKRPAGATIIYVTLQRTAETVARLLRELSHEARAYHAGLKDELRGEIQDWFFTESHPIVVATIAFGMGIDKSDIRYVYHYNLPKSLENYSQEIGRAGRDGEDSLCEVFLCPDDLGTLENFVYGDTPSAESVETLVETLFDGNSVVEVSPYDLGKHSDIRPLVVKTLLTYLELEGWIRGGTPVYSEYRFKPNLSSKELFEHFTEVPRDFLVRVFRYAKKGRVWLKLDVGEVALGLQVPRERIVHLFNRLSEEELIDLEAGRVRWVYSIERRPSDISELANSLYRRMVAREKTDVERLDSVVQLATTPKCQVQALTHYFGDGLKKPCGHCTYCLDGKPAEPLHLQPIPIDEGEWERLRELREQHLEVLREPRAVARFLIGVTSPQLTLAKLNRHELFGCMEKVRFKTLQDRADEDLASP